MDRVEILKSALSDRRAELEQADGALAGAELELTEAQETFAKTNDDYQPWLDAKNRVEFCTHDVEKKRASVEQCRQNVQCAETALVNAQRESKIESLQARHAAAELATERSAQNLSEGIVDLLARAIKLDELGMADTTTCRELSQLGVRVNPVSPVHAVLVKYLREHGEPNQILLQFASSSLGGHGGAYLDGINHGLARVLVPLVALGSRGANSVNRTQQLGMLGDPEAQKKLKAESQRAEAERLEKRAAFEKAYNSPLPKREPATFAESLGEKIRSLVE